jgi:predicted ATPase/DNA-binding CsgD family transcriptional regulator
MDGKQYSAAPLTTRELEILRLVALGLSNRDVAEELVIAPETVRWYTKQIYSKLGISGRIQAVNLARELGLLSSETIAAPVPTTQPNIPSPITTFIGRAHEIADIKRLLQTARLLTLTGVGGTGKTRLALRAASEMKADFADGVCFVDLAPLNDTKLVANAIAAAFGVIGNLNESLFDTLKRALADQEILLLIDNFEHVIGAAPLVSDLLVLVPSLKALVTSREALRLSGEQEYAIPSLSLPAADAISIQAVAESEAGSLFVQRAQMVQPGFVVNAENAPSIAQICTRLDGLPLAIELAAARCKLLTPQAMLTRLNSPLAALTGGTRDAPPRQQTLRATLDWSYNLLDEGEKKLFARLAIFQGGRSLEAIEAVCQPDLPIDVFDGLAALVDKSLVQQKETPAGESRFVMLETIHEYARERLAESGEAEIIQRRYAGFFVEWAERAEPELRLSEQYRWFRLLEIERDNFRAVFEWSLEEDAALGVRLAGSLFMFWQSFSFVVEGSHWTQRLLERLAETPKIFHAKFLICAGYIAWFDDIERAKQLFTRALEISRALKDRFHEAWAFTYMSITLSGNDAFSAAEAGLSLFQELDYKPGIAQAFNIIGELARVAGKIDRARRAYRECQAVAVQTGDRRIRTVLLFNLASIAQYEGDHQSAIDLLRQSFEFCRDVNDTRGMAIVIQILAGSVAAIGEPERAAQLLGAAEVVLEHMGAITEPHDKPELERNIAAVRAQLDEAIFQSAWAEGRAMSLEQAVDYGMAEI